MCKVIVIVHSVVMSEFERIIIGPPTYVAEGNACDPHWLAEERALGADFLLEPIQCSGDTCISLRRCQCVQPPGLQVVLGNTKAFLVKMSEHELRFPSPRRSSPLQPLGRTLVTLLTSSASEVENT